MPIWPLALAAAFLLADEPHPAALVGRYDGGQTEVAAGLELGADGRFRYGLSYGALDETAAGTWRFEAGRVLLTTDPFKPPRIALVARQAETPGELHVTVEVPKQIRSGLFAVAIRDTNGATRFERIAEADLHTTWKPGDTTIWLVLPAANLQSAPVTPGPNGETLRFRFEPNELGKADFRETPLTVEGRDLLFDRFGRHLRFRVSEVPPVATRPRAGP